MLALFFTAAAFLAFGSFDWQTAAEPALENAQQLVDEGKFSDAESAVRQYIQAHQNSAEAHYLLGYILFKENNPKPSLAEYAEGARYRTPNAVDLEVIGGDYFLLEDYVAADKWLTKSVERDGNNALALYFLGRAKYNEQHFEEAIQAFTRCLKLDPKNTRAGDYLGLSYEQLGKTENALAAYRAAIAIKTDTAQGNAEPYLHLGALLVENGRASEGLPYLLQAVQISPRDSEAHRAIGKAYLTLNRLDHARTELEKAVELEPQSAPARFLLGEVYRKSGLAEKARIEMERYNALTAGHSSLEDSLAEARSLLNGGKLQDAEQVVRRYLESHRNSADGHYLLGYILFKKQDPKSSLAEYTEGAKYRKPGPYDLEAVAGDYVLLHDYADADKWFTKSVEWNPGNAQALYYLGRTKYNENRFDEAIGVFKRCLKIDPTNVKAEDNLGLSYAGLGRTEEAMAAYRTAIAWQVRGAAKDAGPYVDLGTLLVDNDRSTEAIPYLIEALEISPGETRAERELGKAYLHSNQLEKAQTQLEKAVRLAPKDAPTHFILAQVYRKRGLQDKARLETQQFTALSGMHSAPESAP